jgi:hypothetical protein
MLNFIKKLFGTEQSAKTTTEFKGVEAKTTLEFHEEIKQQVEDQSFPVAKEKPAAKKAPAKATAKKAPARKSKKQ